MYTNINIVIRRTIKHKSTKFTNKYAFININIHNTLKLNIIKPNKFTNAKKHHKNNLINTAHIIVKKKERKPITGINGFVIALNSKAVIHHSDGSEIREGALKVRLSRRTLLVRLSELHHCKRDWVTPPNW